MSPPADASHAKVLVIEDEKTLAGMITAYLSRAGYETHMVHTGPDGVEAVRSLEPDVVILDLGLPGLDGIEVCRQIRTFSDCYVIVVTARSDEVDTLIGLSVGADDYVTKPFSPREIVARVKAILRRGQPDDRDAHDITHLGDDYEVDVTRREARYRGQAVALATREFDLLAHLSRNQGIALSRQQLLDSVWGVDWVGDDRTVDVHVRQLRKKLGDDLPLATVWGIGYRLG